MSVKGVIDEHTVADYVNSIVHLFQLEPNVPRAVGMISHRSTTKNLNQPHNNDVIMGATASEITSFTIV